ncbi:MAG: chloride channel protein [Planctomycetes bacterium]|nr:chloride channel protein [Planctomycetota bacterium]MBI3843742.1 chloride channel protein [Planctomycetota bacterium]
MKDVRTDAENRDANGADDKAASGNGRIRKGIVASWHDPRLRESGKWLILPALVGVVAGVGAIAFDLLFRWCSAMLLMRIGGYSPPAPGAEGGGAGFGPLASWRLPIATTLGGLVSGFLVYLMAPEAEGHGTDGVIQAFHVGLGKIRRRVPLVKLVASSITIGSGGSAGREGPIAQIGAGFGSFLGDAFRLTDRERRLLMLAGTAGGIGAIFRAPLGAGLFAAEVLYREPEFEYEGLLPGLVSAIVGYSIYASYAGWDPMFATPPLVFRHPLELVPYALLGLVCAIVGAIYVKTFYGVRDRFFALLPLPKAIKPAIGALLLGLAAMSFPQVLGMGYGYVQQAIDGRLAVTWMLGFVALKIVATSLTISSGGSGGVFGPSLAIGGVLGGAFGWAAHSIAPNIVHSPAAFVMVGMGAFFSGAAKVPLASVVMVMEMTGSYGLLVPTLLASVIAYLLTPLRVSLYENQVATRRDSRAHLGSFAVDVLSKLRVRDAVSNGLDARVVASDILATTFMHSLHENHAPAFAIVDSAGDLVGLLTYARIRQAILKGIRDDMTVLDLADRDVEPVSLDDDIRAALDAFLTHETELMPVSDSPGSRRLVGFLSRHDVLVAYDRELGRSRDSR